MFIARRDLWFAKGRFALMGAVVAMLALLMVLLTGLATGLVDDNISGVRNLPASHLAFNAESGVKFNQSTVERRQWEEARTQPGVRAAAPLGNSLFNAHAFRSAAAADSARQEVLARGKSTGQDGKAVDLALFGVEPGSFIAPASAEGQALGATERGVVVSEALASKQGVQVGDTLVLDRVGTELPVIGITGKANYGHVPIVYAPLSVWQEASFGPPGGPSAGQELAPAVRNVATLVALDTTTGFSPSSVDQLGLTTVTLTKAFDGSPGYKEETGTLQMIEGFLYVIAAMLVGAFFTVWTIQRKQEIGLIKALGASNGYLLKDALGQALVVLVVATAAGVLVGLGLGFVIPGGAPFALQPGPVLLAAVLVVVMGLVGASLSLRRITKVDPLIALGGAR